MGAPKSVDARMFYRSAWARYEDARVLWKSTRSTGTVYLDGYAVECILKALILTTVRAADRDATLKTFRGSKAHNLEWLELRYLAAGGVRFPREVRRHLIVVADWSTDLRYGRATWVNGTPQSSLARPARSSIGPKEGFSVAVNISVGKSDAVVDQIAAVLGAYAAAHPAAQIDLYRFSPASIRVRIVDPAFAGQDRPSRVRDVWRYLDPLDEEAHADISSLVLLAPGEQARSVANAVFENPDDEDFDFAAP